MTRKTFLTVTALVALVVGGLALFGPDVLLEHVKNASPSAPANVMARTAGVLLVAMGVLNLLVRGHGDSPTMRAILIANLVLQVLILPIDPLAYATGVFRTLGSFLPNTILHVGLAAGFAHFLARAYRPQIQAGAPASSNVHEQRFKVEQSGAVK
jgi:hypothetical protein